LPWVEFDAEQAHTWETLMESSFVLERHFYLSAYLGRIGRGCTPAPVGV
jgi:hypothetical protein